MKFGFCSFCYLLVLILLLLKVFGAANLSWWVVFLPLLGPFAVLAFWTVIAIIGCAAAIATA